MTDNGVPNLADSETITVTVNELNVAPVLNAIGNQTVNELELLSFTATASDVDDPANTLSFSLAGGTSGAVPAGASIDPGTGLFSWTPTEAQGPGTYTFDVVVTDNGIPNLADSETITVTVNELNVAPVLDAIGNQTVNELALLSFTATASDADDPANTLSFSLASGTSGAVPAGASIDPGTGLFSWTPTEAQGPGTFTFDVVVTDNGVPNLADSETITVTVNELNVAPVLDAIGNQTVNELELLSFTATASDVDDPANTLSFSLAGGTSGAVPAGASIDPGTGLFSWTPTEAQGPGTFTFDVVVTDNGVPNLADSETITVTVNELNVAPVLDAIGNQTVNELALLSFTATASDGDLPANNLTYSLDGASLAAGMTINPSTGQFNWTPSESQGPGTYDVSVTVTDDGMTNGLADFKTSTQSFQIDVSEFAPNPITVEVRVAASSDDAEERPSTSVTLTSSDLEMSLDGSNEQIVGIRFTGLNIPAGATIQNAYIQFQADEANSEVTELTISGEDVDNATTFESTSGNISSRSTTAVSVPWSPAPWTTIGEAGPDQRTSNIRSVIQEIVNRSGWSSGNSLGIIITGTGKRVAESFNGVANAAPLLHVEYVTGSNQPPATLGIDDINVNTNDANTEIDLFAAFDDFEDPDDALTYSIVNNTNPSLFAATTINGVPRTLTLDYAPDTDGTAEITVRATDTGNLSAVTTFTVTVSPFNLGNPVTIQSRVAAGSDDAEESASGGVSLTSSDLELTLESTQQVVGMRFTGLNIPPGSTIQNAYIQFQADEANSEATLLTISGQAIDNAPTFTSTSGDISNRTTTTASVAWSPEAWPTIGEAGPNQQTPNLKAVVQEIVNRPGWVLGNSLAVIITGTGKRVAESFNGVASVAPLLVVEYLPNDIPIAVNDSATTSQNSAVTTNVLTNDFLADPPANITAVTHGTSGSVSFDNSAGTTTYTPNTNFTGSDSYTYTITDTQGNTSTATVDVTVTAQCLSRLLSESSQMCLTVQVNMPAWKRIWPMLVPATNSSCILATSNPKDPALPRPTRMWQVACRPRRSQCLSFQATTSGTIAPTRIRRGPTGTPT